jgi:hypothetical protein
LLFLLAIPVAYLFIHRSSTPDSYLFDGESFAPVDLQAMQMAFAKSNLNNYMVEGSKIRIPRSQQNAYMAALAEQNALPKNLRDILEKTRARSALSVDVASHPGGPWIARLPSGVTVDLVGVG